VWGMEEGVEWEEWGVDSFGDDAAAAGSGDGGGGEAPRAPKRGRDEGDAETSAGDRGRGSREGGRGSSSRSAGAAASGLSSSGRRASAREREVALAIHQEHVMLMLSRAVVLNGCCEDAGVRSAAAYLLDSSVGASVTVRSAGGGMAARSVGGVRGMLRAFEAAVAGAESGAGSGSVRDETDEGLSAEELMCAIACRELGGRASVARVQAFVAVWRQLGVPARLVAGLDPAPVRPGRDGVMQGIVPQGEVGWWAEVWCRAGGEGAAQQQHRWVHAGVADGFVDAPEGVRARGRGGGGGGVTVVGGRCPYPYVVGFEGSGRARDITQRYCARYNQDVVPLRGPEAWFKELVASFGSGNPIHGAVSAGAMSGTAAGQREREREAGEQAEMEARKADEGLPTSQAAFKAHPLYALEKLLRKNQVVWPREPVVGYFAGLPVYPREHVRELKSAAAWVRESLRQVKMGEVPMSTLKKRSQGRQAQAERAERAIERAVAATEAGVEYASHVTTQEEREVGLFGEWQTEPWQRPSAEGGRVPRNVFGNVECWTPEHVPLGCVHLRHDRAVAVAKSLGVDHAPAVVSFEIKAGRTVPKYDGAVVCEEAADFVGDALAQDDAVRAEKERERKAKAALGRWRLLVKALTIREQLKHDFYGTASAAAAKSAGTIQGPRKKTSGGRGDDVPAARMPPDLQNVDHTHVWSTETCDPATGLWRRSCACGLSVEFEKM